MALYSRIFFMYFTLLYSFTVEEISFGRLSWVCAGLRSLQRHTFAKQTLKNKKINYFD